MSTRLMSPQAPDVSSSSERRARNLRLYHEEQLETGFSDKGLLADVWPFLKPQKFWLSVALGAVVATAILSLIRPLIMLWAIDESIKTGDPAVMMRGGAAFAGVAILEQLIGFAQIY